MMWLQAQQHPESPPFTGGVLDAWPAAAVDAFAILNAENRMIAAFLESRKKKAPHG